MENVRKIDTVEQYNQRFGVETLHPLVSVIDMSQAQPADYIRANYGIYCVFLKDVKCGDLHYGKQYYDYQEGTIVSIAPGQIVGVDDPNRKVIQPKGWALVFHPDLIKGTSLGKRIHEYTFFSYESNEALHISEQERQIFLDCLNKIQIELQRPVDKHTKHLVAMNIELLLDYCMRFYDRQFVTRTKVNKDILSTFEGLLHEYFDGEKAAEEGLPSVRYFAGKVCLSANYFGDLIKKETGKSAKEYIQLKLIDIAKERVLGSKQTISQIAYSLGFQYPQHFTRIFKKVVGCSPNEYRLQI